MTEKSFYIFVNNNISKSRYFENTCNFFKTDIHPLIELDSSINWEVAITSAIIPFISYKEDDILYFIGSFLKCDCRVPCP